MPKPPKTPQSRTQSVMKSTKKDEQAQQALQTKIVENPSKKTPTLLSLKGTAKTSFLIRPSSVKSKKAFPADVTVYDKMPKEAERQAKTVAMGLNPNVLIFEENFVKDYHVIETQLKEREIKFFKCIGDPALEPAEKQEIVSLREENTKHSTEFKRDNDLHRYVEASTNERVVVPVDISIETNCKWNILSNDLFSLRQRNLNNLVKMCTTVLTRIRLSHRTAKLKARFDEVNINLN